MCHNIQGVENMKSLISSPFALFLYSCSVLYIEYTIKVLASQSDELMTSNNTCSQFLININPSSQVELPSNPISFEDNNLGQEDESEEPHEEGLEEDVDPVDDFSSATDQDS